MRLILQRVTKSEVRVEGETVGRIGRGMLVLAGVESGDGSAQVQVAVAKLAGLRIFEDDAGRMNLDAGATDGAFLIVSQFTVAGQPLARGRRPSFGGAAPPEVAERLLKSLADGLRREGFQVETGRFGAHMEVELVNDGPVTFVLEI